MQQGEGQGGQLPPQILADQLTLSQPGGLIMPTTVLPAPPDFGPLLHPCNGGDFANFVAFPEYMNFSTMNEF